MAGLPALALTRTLRPLPLHVNVAVEMRAVGNRHTRRDQIAVDRPVVPDVDAFGRGEVARHLTLNHNRLRGNLRLDPGIRSDGQHVLAQLDLALDLTVDSQILAAAQFSLDDASGS